MRDLLETGRDKLIKVAADPLREARMLLLHVTGKTCPDTNDLSDQTVTAFHALIDRRARHEPMSHLLGRRAFYKHDFIVSPAVLDPRPETEVLVQAALEQDFDSVLDLGTGSGCIILSLLAERLSAQGVAVDISPPALDIAAQNAALIGVGNRLSLHASDWLDSVTGRFDLIVSNPPYIAAREMPGLAPDVRLYEPHIALTDHADGLSAYRRIAADAPDFLTPGGRLMVECGHAQGQDIAALFTAAGLCDITVIPDLDGRDRVIKGVKRN